MFRILFVLSLVIAPIAARAATCPPGEYLLNGVCTKCQSQAYCPGDDNMYSCLDLFGAQNGIRVLGVTSLDGLTNANECLCEFVVNTPGNKTTTNEIWRGNCADGPTEYAGVLWYHCRAGFYSTDARTEYSRYEQCTPCTNQKPENAEYSNYGAPETNDCPWKCSDGYKINTDGTACDKLCTLGFTTLNTSTGITVPLYEDKRTTPSINIGDVNGACHADLAPGRATGAINVMYNGEIYHTISPTTTLQCDAGYWLDDDVCNACPEEYYCPGDNTRISCETTFVEEPNVPRPEIYSESRFLKFTHPSQCRCTWRNLSDERRVKYFAVGYCVRGVGATNNTRVEYQNCRTGYYAITPTNMYNWYRDCAPCDNGPANSHYTSYSTPSVMYAVESNCPWECDDGYVQNGDTCVAE